MTDQRDSRRRRAVSPYKDLADLTDDAPIPLLDDSGGPPALLPTPPWLAGLIVAFILIAISITMFQLLRTDEASGADATTTIAVATTTPDASGTTSTASTSTTTAPAPTPYAPVGDPIPIDELRLVTSGIGEIGFGTSAELAIGRLVASLGTPDEDTGERASTGAFGICPGEIERIVRWGPLAAVISVALDGTETFAGYRVDVAFGGVNSPAAELATLSGLRTGDDVGDLLAIYRGFDLQLVVDESLGNVFELRNTEGDLLLWGPISAPDPDGLVLGIFAPDACAG